MNFNLIFFSKQEHGQLNQMDMKIKFTQDLRHRRQGCAEEECIHCSKHGVILAHGQQNADLPQISLHHAHSAHIDSQYISDIHFGI